MTVICEECGKVYHLDPDKVEQYRGKNVQVRCGECGHVMQLSKLLEMEEEPASESYEAESAETDFAMDTGSDEPASESVGPDTSSTPPEQESPSARESTPSRRSGLLGLRGKMMLLFLLVPILIIAGMGYFSQWQLNRLADNITEESTDLVLEQGKEKLMQKARDVALQCEIYLRAHPELSREDFNYDPEFSSIAVQSVGKTGYTYLHQPPEPKKDLGSVIWAHPNPNMVGLDDPDMLRKALGPFFEPFWEIVTDSWGGEESEGFYKWKDPDGKIRTKYMAITPIELQGKPFMIGATAYIDEFTQKTAGLEASANEMATNSRNINFAILIGAIVLIGLCISIYGYRISRKITYLTEAAERISVGDLEAEIDVKSKDEIGSLADAISRMQDSLRFSIERLRRRR